MVYEAFKILWIMIVEICIFFSLQTVALWYSLHMMEFLPCPFFFHSNIMAYMQLAMLQLCSSKTEIGAKKIQLKSHFTTHKMFPLPIFFLIFGERAGGLLSFRLIWSNWKWAWKSFEMLVLLHTKSREKKYITLAHTLNIFKSCNSNTNRLREIPVLMI